MSLQVINKQIHSYRRSELQSNLSTILTDIKNILVSNERRDEEYFRNHTGRELVRRLFIFDMVSDISSVTSDYDDGFRPTELNTIKAYGGGSPATFRILTESSEPMLTENSDHIRQE
tara:strand:- start:4280 stop:4630 length:351 start_codon:yes stop_codon:yes gene_type:complete